MAIYAIADPHLSGSVPKSMEKFGRRWTGYADKLERRWRARVTDADTVVIPGDVSWAMTLPEATADLRFLASLPGKKLIGKGNHDFWWSTVTKMQKFLEQNAIHGIEFLYNNAYDAGSAILCGTRGWFLDETQQNTVAPVDYEKLVNRETIRLELCLREAKHLQEKRYFSEKTILPIHVFLHFPPVFGAFRVDSFVALFHKYRVEDVWYGHIHGNYSLPATVAENGIRYHLISADFLDFYPARVAGNV